MGQSAHLPEGDILPLSLKQQHKNFLNKTLFPVAVALIIASGIAIRLYLIFSDLDVLITNIPDDAFYYLRTAQYMANGFGSTFDGKNVTNGYHVLWMLLLLPLAKWIPNPINLLISSLLLSTVLFAISTILLTLLISKVCKNHFAILLGLLLYSFNPQIIQGNINGIETSLVNLIFIEMILHLVTHTEMSYFQYGLLGFLQGMLMLARSDMFVYIAIVGLYTLWQNPGIKKLVINGLAFVFVISPWFIWSYINFGEVIQVSGSALPFIIKTQIVMNGQNVFTSGLQDFINLLIYRLGSYLGFQLLFGLMIILFLIRTIRTQRDKFTGLLLGLLFGGLILIYIHTAVRFYPRNWYFNQLIIISILAFVISVNNYRKEIQALIFVCFAIYLPMMSQVSFSKGIYPHQIQMLKAGLWLGENTPIDATIVSFNSGIISFFSQRSVVNLDGVINNSAFDAIKEKALFRYIEDQNAQYYVDYDPLMFEWYHPFLGESQELEVKLIYSNYQPLLHEYRHSIYKLE